MKPHRSPAWHFRYSLRCMTELNLFLCISSSLHYACRATRRNSHEDAKLTYEFQINTSHFRGCLFPPEQFFKHYYPDDQIVFFVTSFSCSIMVLAAFISPFQMQLQNQKEEKKKEKESKIISQVLDLS